MDTKEFGVTEDLIRKTANFWEDPKKIMRLIDLLFLFDDPDKREVCS